MSLFMWISKAWDTDTNKVTLICLDQMNINMAGHINRDITLYTCENTINT